MSQQADDLSLMKWDVQSQTGGKDGLVAVMGYGSGSIPPGQKIQCGPVPLSHCRSCVGLVCRIVAGGAKEGEEFGVILHY